MHDDAPHQTSAEISRRRFLQFSGIGIGALGLIGLSGCGIFTSREQFSTFGQVDFTNPLQVPPLADSTVENGVRTFDLVTQSGRSAIVPAGESDTWGINGTLLGPTIRASRGEEVAMRVRNELDEPTTMHWHGMRVPAEADGTPHQMIQPGATWLPPSWIIDQPAATLWYHPHPHGETERHVYQGLSGLFILDDDAESGLDLPREYGVDDIPVIVQDKSFDEQGQLVETERQDNGMLGDTILVNGTVGPVLDVTAERTRLRLLNGSTARSYSFGFSDDRHFDMIASDGGLLAGRVALTRIMLSPGERAEIVVELVAGESTVLRSFPHDLGVTDRLAESTGAQDELEIMQLVGAPELRHSPMVPDKLGELPTMDASDAESTRTFALGNNRINGERMDMERIDFAVPAQSVEIWEVINEHTQPHNFHVHDVQFQVLDIDGQAPPPELAGWKDTVYTPPGVPYRLIMRFGKHTNPDVPYMYHCHLLWHEDQGMMGQFVVVEPGQEPGSIDGDHDH